MAEKLYVDVAAVDAAVGAIQQTADSIAVTRVRRIGAPSGVFGHEGLAEAVTDFCVRWDDGVESLCHDAREMVTRLREAAAGYEAAEAGATASTSPPGGARLARTGAVPR